LVAVADLIATGMDKKEAIRKVALAYGCPKREIYQLFNYGGGTTGSS
jgi:hypothetical protein